MTSKSSNHDESCSGKNELLKTVIEACGKFLSKNTAFQNKQHCTSAATLYQLRKRGLLMERAANHARKGRMMSGSERRNFDD